MQGGAVSVAVRHVAGRLGRLPSAPSFLPLIAPSAARQTATSWARSGVPGRCGDAFVGARRCYSIVCGAPVVARPVLSRALVWPSRQRASRAPLLLWRRWSSGAPAGGGAKGPEEQGWRQWMLSKDKIKALWREYGYLFIGSYFTVYFATLGSAFVMVRKGYVPGPDPAEWLRTSSLKAWLLPNTDIPLSPAVSDFLKAWLLTKLTEPVRAVVTIIAVPVLARRLPARVMDFLRRP